MSEGYPQSLRRGIGDSMHTREALQHGKPHGVLSDEQPDAREGQAGRPGVTERPVVPLKPGNAGGEGRGLSSRSTQEVARDLEIGQPINSEACSETTEGVTRESEG